MHIDIIIKEEVMNLRELRKEGEELKGDKERGKMM